MKRMACALVMAGVACAAAGVPRNAFASSARVTSTLQLSILSPDQTINGDRMSLDVSFRGSSIETMELYLDNALVAKRQLNTAQNRGVISFGVDTVLLTEGAHRVMVKAYSALGLSGSSAATIHVPSVDLSAPVRIAYPLNGVQVSGVVPVKVALDPSIQKLKPYVTFFVDKELKVLRNFPPYEYVWDTNRVSNGWHIVEAWTQTDDSFSPIKARSIHVNVNNGGGQTAIQNSVPDLSLENSGVKPTSSGAQSTQPSNIGASSAKPGITDVRTAVVGATNNGLQSSRVRPSISDSAVSSVKPSGPGIARLSSQTAVPGNASIANESVKTVAVKPTAESPSAMSVEPSGNSMGKTSAPRIIAPLMTVNNNGVKSTDVSPVAGQTVGVKPANSVYAITTRPLENPSDSSAGIKLQTAPINPQSMGSAISRPGAKIKGAVQATPVNPEKVAVVSAINLVVPPIRAKSWQSLLSTHKGVFDVAFDNDRIVFDVMPRVSNGVGLAPFRQIFEHTGGQLYWFGGSAQTVRAVNATREIELKIGSNHALVNNQTVLMEHAPYIVGGRTIVPFSFIRDSMDVSIHFDPESGRLLIESLK